MIYEKIKNNKIIKAVCAFQATSVYIYVLCALAVLSNAFGLDAFIIAPMLILLCITNLFADNVIYASPVVFTVAFCISPQHSPAKGDLSYYLSVPFLCVTGPLVLAVFITAIIRAVKNKNFKNISFKRGLALGAVAYSAALLLNGTFSAGHDILDFSVGALTVFTIAGLYFFFVATIDGENINYEYLCTAMVASGFVALLQLGVIYVKNVGSFTALDNEWKGLLYSGWGISNTIGQYVAMMIPPCFYFAIKKGRILTSFVLAAFLYAGTYFSLCRSGMLIGAAVCVVCVILTCIFVENKKRSIICTVIFGALLALVYFVSFFGKKFPDFFDFLRNVGFSDRGRFEIWKNSVDLFLKNPVFGAGFNAYSRDYNCGFSLGFAHNTPIQILSSCGAVGVIAFVYFRVQTVKLCVYKITPVRALLIMEILSYIALGWLDITGFSPYFNMVFAVLIAAMEKESLTDENFCATLFINKRNSIAAKAKI